MERKKLHILLSTAACHMRSCHTHSPRILGELRFSCCFCALFFARETRTNVIIMLKIIWHFSPQRQCHVSFVSLLLLELPLLCANLQIYMQRSCSIKSSKPDHKQGYFMCASCPFLGTGLEQRRAMTNWPESIKIVPPPPANATLHVNPLGNCLEKTHSKDFKWNVRILRVWESASLSYYCDQPSLAICQCMEYLR